MNTVQAMKRLGRWNTAVAVTLALVTGVNAYVMPRPMYRAIVVFAVVMAAWSLGRVRGRHDVARDRLAEIEERGKR